MKNKRCRVIVIAANVQGFALGQSEITNYSTLGSVAANCFSKATLPARPSAKPLVGGSNIESSELQLLGYIFYRSIKVKIVDQGEIVVQ